MRRTQRRRQVLQRVQRLWHRVVLLRTHRQRQRLRRRQLVRAMMRQLRLQVRRRVVLCCLVVVARRRLVRRLVRVLVVLEDRLNLRAWLRVRLWLVVVDQRMMRARLLQRQRKLEVAVIVRCNRQQARLRVQRCHRVEGRHLMRRVRQHRQRRMRVLLWTMLQRSQVRRLVLLWCTRAVVSVRRRQLQRTLLEMLVDRRMPSLVLVRQRRREPTHDTEASTRV